VGFGAGFATAPWASEKTVKAVTKTRNMAEDVQGLEDNVREKFMCFLYTQE
jgi:hypothetical protein